MSAASAQSRSGVGFRGIGSVHARVYIALVAATFVFCAMLFTGLDRYGRRDWDQFTFRYEAPRAALLRDHEVPLWNPYVNGGTVLMAHPDSPFPSPWYALVLVLGAPTGLRVQVVVFMAIGAIGAAVLLRRWRLPPAACFLGGVLFMMSAHFALQIAEGHLEWCALGLMPWVILSQLRSFDDRRFVLVTGLLLSSILLFGSVYILAVYLPFIFWWMAFESLKRRSLRPPVLWVTAVALMLLLSAVKMWPQLEFLSANPREQRVVAHPLKTGAIGNMFFNPRQDLLYAAVRDIESIRHAEERGVPFAGPTLPQTVSGPIHIRLRDAGVTDQWHEYGIYMTWLGLALATLGLVVSWKANWPFYSAGGLAALVVLSADSPVDVWALLQQLPLYKSLTVPSRFLAAVAFVLAVAAAHGLGWVSARIRSRSFVTRALATYVVPLVILLELTAQGWRLWGDIFVFPRQELASHDTFAVRYKEISTNYPGMYSYTYPLISANSGELWGYENMRVPQGAVRLEGDPEYRGEAYLEDAGTPVLIRSRTMSKFDLEFAATGPGTLVINQNYSEGWIARVRGTSGTRDQRATRHQSGLVAVALSDGDVAAYVHYQPRSFVRGLWISGASWTAIIGLLWWAFKRQRSGQEAR